MNEERFAAETKKIQSVIAKASQKVGALSALSDGGKMSREKLQLTLEETAYFFESATLYLRTLCETQMPGAGGYGRQLLTAYTQRTNFRLHFKQMLLVIDEHSNVDGRHVFDQDNKGWKAVSNALKGLVIDDDDQYHLSVHMMSSRSAENVCHISLVLPESEEEFFRFHRKGIAYRPLEPSVALCPSTSFCLV